MTTGTGAFGLVPASSLHLLHLANVSSLNLQSVNRVFIVEPQWNPSVERQAVARAIRLGQKQEVLVTRYIVNDSIEQVRLYTFAAFLGLRRAVIQHCHGTLR